MSSQANTKRKKKGRRGLMPTLSPMKKRRGLSAIIGYLLLVAISISMSILVYVWLKGYVPNSEQVECPDGTSVLVRDLAYTCTPGGETLNISLKNNGKFSINGYFIAVSDDPNPDALPDIDISSKIKLGGNISANSIVFNYLIYNYLTPNEPTNIRSSSFDVSSYGRLYKVKITPTRIEEEGNKRKVVSCSNAVVEEALVCS